MATIDLQDGLLKAIDTLTQNRIDKLQLDKTITATIVKCTNSLTREYKASYNGGNILCYAQENAAYTNGQAVYVLVPENDFTKTKVIVGKAQAASDDNNISFVSSAISNYNLIGRNVLSDRYNLQPIGLHSYLKEEYVLLYEYGQQANSDNKYLIIDGDELSNNLREAEAVLLEASFKTRLPKAHRVSKSGVYGLQFVLAFADKDATDEEGNPATKYLSYVIDSNNMTGNPFNSTQWSEQYMIYPIDIENFLYIDSIMFYSKDFVEVSDLVQADDQLGWGADIFLKDVEFYGLKTITATSGDYKLSISMPEGNTLKNLTDQASVQVMARFTEKNTNNLSDNTTFYWFREDGRITSSSEDYQMYGGAGWARMKDKGYNYNFITYGNENRAYENNYLVVAIYKEKVILKDYFTIYNDAAKRDLSIESSLGERFTFDRGIPTLTCLVDGREEDFEGGKTNPHQDDYFRFVWSKEDTYGNTTSFLETKEELEQRYKDAVASGELTYADLSAIRSQITALEGVSWDRNKIIYPVKAIDVAAQFKCSVFLRDREPISEDDETVEDIEYNIGSASITLTNESAASPNDYYITIENGDQVFQYSESGVSPDDDRYADPLEIKPLTCHFFDPAGLEVNSKTYEVKWKVPLTDSMIVVPTEGMTMNNATEKVELCVSETFPMAIKGDYDYQALNNQITCIVSYNGQEYTQPTSFLFTKVGENGTNGTDLVCKISPTSSAAILKTDCLALELNQGEVSQYNTGQTISDTVLQFSLYQRNERLTTSDASVSWSVSSSNTRSKYLGVISGALSWTTEGSTSKKFRNQIVRANLRWEGTDYYAFYPIPVIDYTSGNRPYDVHIDLTRTLKSITYNADGRNPLYNKNQGILVSLGDGTLTRYVVWTAEGGEPVNTRNTYSDNPTNAAFDLIAEKNSSDGVNLLEGENLYEAYILPNDSYTGEYTNNLVHGRVYTSKDVYDNGGNPEVEIYIPIYMSLNTYGLKSLNAWDGNHIEINEDENYILAPQIGAGEKDDENKFTGIVMGTSQTYDQDEASIGLLGYSHGKQSIFLDAETGNAIFGLPESQASQENEFNEGRVELIPGGTSSIGNWKIGSRSLYNIVANVDVQDEQPQLGNKYSDLGDRYKSSIPHALEGVLMSSDPAYLSIKGRLLEDGDDPDAAYGSANTIVQPHDAFEIQIDPNSPSIFTLFRHTTSDEDRYYVIEDNKIYLETDTEREKPYSTAIVRNGVVVGWTLQERTLDGYVFARKIYDADTDTYSGSWYFSLLDDPGDYYIPEMLSDAQQRQDANRRLFEHFAWHREAKVGINNQGRFYTNALKDNTTALNIGDLGAFGESATRRKYVGATFEIGTENNANSLVKFFTDSEDVDSDSGTLYMSGATTTRSEYERPLSLHFKEFSLYTTATSNNIEKFTNNRLLLNDFEAQFGHEQAYLSVPSNDNIELVSGSYGVSIVGSDTGSMSVSGGSLSFDARAASGKGDVSLAATGVGNLSFDDSLTVVSGKDYSLTNEKWQHTMISNTLTLGSLDKKAYLELKSGGESTLLSDSITMKSTLGRVYINSNGSSGGIVLQATPINGQETEGLTFSLLPQNGGSASHFSLRGPNGTIASRRFEVNGVERGAVEIQPMFTTKAGYFVGAIDEVGSNDINKATSVLASKDIRSMTNVIAPALRFSENKRYGGYVNSSSVWDHLNQLYALVDNAYQRAVTAETNANNYTAGQITSTRGWVTNNHPTFTYVSNNYVSKDAYNNHGHRLTSLRGWHALGSWDTYNVAGVGDISHIRSTYELANLFTDNPSRQV